MAFKLQAFENVYVGLSLVLFFILKSVVSYHIHFTTTQILESKIQLAFNWMLFAAMIMAMAMAMAKVTAINENCKISI